MQKKAIFLLLSYFFLMLLCVQSIVLAQNPRPDIKVNSSDGPITVSDEDTVSIALSLDAGDVVSETADWWLVELTPAGTLNYLDLFTASFMPGFATTYQGPVFGFGSTVILNLSNLTIGSHTYYFGIDTNMNGSLDVAQLYFDSVLVTSEYSPSPSHFDGIWTGQVISTTAYNMNGHDCGYGDIILNVNENQITGSGVDHVWHENYTISGIVTPEGNINTCMAYDDDDSVISFTGSLSGNSGSGTWQSNSGCLGTWSVTKQQN
jgi:hypothetical protein